MSEWIVGLLASGAGVCLGRWMHRQRVAGELEALRSALEAEHRSTLERVQDEASARWEALDRELQASRAGVSQREGELRRLLEEGRVREGEANRELSQFRDQLSEQDRAAARARDEATRAREEARTAVEALRARAQELEQLRLEASRGREEVSAAEADARGKADALQEVLGRAERHEAAARAAVAVRDQLQQALEEERRLRHGCAGRVTELEAEVDRLQAEHRQARGGGPPPPATTVTEQSSARQPFASVPLTERPPDRPAEAFVAEPPRTEPPFPLAGGLTVLDVLESDRNLKPGQRETIRIVYSRFAPKAIQSTGSSPGSALTVLDVLEGDPNLNRGHRETIRTMYAQFVPKARS